MNTYVIGIDLGGTKICAALADLQGNIKVKKTIPTEADCGDTHVLDRMINIVKEIKSEGKVAEGELKAIGIGSPGPLDNKTGEIIEPVNLPFKNFNIVNPLKKEFNVPVYLDNDANVAAIGEYMLGAGKGTDNMVYLTVSTGVGGGAILNGKIYRGSTSNALEIGHSTIVPDGPKCNCGNYGCMEAVSSGTAIGRRGTEAVKAGKETSLSKYEKITAKDVFKEAEKGDKVADEILDSCLIYLGIGVANAVSIFDPDMVVIGGGVSMAGDRVFDTVRKVVKQRVMKTMADNCKIVQAKLKSDSGVIGAVALAIMELK